MPPEERRLFAELYEELFFFDELVTEATRAITVVVGRPIPQSEVIPRRRPRPRV